MLDRIPYHAEGFRMAENESLDGEMVLFAPATQQVLFSNTTGSLIWGLCDGTRSIAEIIRLLSEAYPDAAATIEYDVIETLTTFHVHGAIEWS